MMRSNRSVLFAALAGLSSGLVFGLLLASRPGREVQAEIRDRVRLGSREVERRLKNVEAHLRELEHSVLEARKHFSERVRGAGESSQWDISGGDVVRELPHLPRR